MNKNLLITAIIWILIINIVAIILTVVDKSRAIKHKWRIPEKTLMLVGLFGGAFSMLVTMKAVRHKTNHKKFMVGLPAEMIFHTAIIFAIMFLIKNGA